jgi:hypothetical protein
MSRITISTSLVLATMLASSASAHISYTNRNFGTLSFTASSITTQSASGAFGWADATDADWGDSHRGRFFRFSVANGGSSVQITVQRADRGTGTFGTFLPGLSLFSGLAQGSPESLAHDGSALSVASRPAGTEGSFRALTDWSIGNDDVYNVSGDPTSGIKHAARLASFSYIGHMADGTSANYGGAPGIIGDGLADGFVTAVFSGLAAGDYSLFVGGANYDAQLTEVGPTYPSYGFDVSVGLVPAPGAVATLALAGLAGRRRSR